MADYGMDFTKAQWYQQQELVMPSVITLSGSNYVATDMGCRVLQ